MKTCSFTSTRRMYKDMTIAFSTASPLVTIVNHPSVLGMTSKEYRTTSMLALCNRSDYVSILLKQEVTGETHAEQKKANTIKTSHCLMMCTMSGDNDEDVGKRELP